MGMGFRVGKGVRVYGGGRGLGVSVGKGPLRYYTRVGGGSGRRSSGRTSAVAYERQVRATERLEEVQAIAELDSQLAEMCQAHLQEFPLAQRPTPPHPKPVDRKELKARLEAEATDGISALKFSERRAAKKSADNQLDAEVAKEESRRADEAGETARAWEDFWQRLLGNEADAVLPALEQAFEDNEAPAAAVSCQDKRVDVVMRWSALDDIVSERKAAVTPGGKPTTKKRTKNERAELYLEAMCSNALVTAKETFAVAPGLDEVGLAVLRATTDPARGDQIAEAILLGLVRREDFDGINWDKVSATAALLGAASGRVGFKGKAANKALYGIDLSDDADERSFIVLVADAIEARVPEEGVPGLELPVRVVVD
jgi:hypothetical protein